MSEYPKPTAQKVVAFFVSVLLFAVSVSLLILNARAMSIINRNKRGTQNITISNTNAQIQLSLLPEHLVRTGTRAMLLGGAGGVIASFLSMMLSLRPVSPQAYISSLLMSLPSFNIAC
jgi:hypothetical protein